MSGIRYLIAVIFLFAGLEDELRAHASQTIPAHLPQTPSDIVTNLKHKTSVDKMTQTAPDGISGFLAERVIDTAPFYLKTFIPFSYDKPALSSCAGDGFRASGSSPPV